MREETAGAMRNRLALIIPLLAVLLFVPGCYRTPSEQTVPPEEPALLGQPTPPEKPAPPAPSEKSEQPEPPEQPSPLPDQAPPPQKKNLFVNGSFEAGAEPWFWIKTSPSWSGFSISSDMAFEGKHAAFLSMRSGQPYRKTAVYGLVQEVAPPEFPSVISGYYYVKNWKRGTPKQYLQFVVIVLLPKGHPAGPNVQIRYILAGIDTPPFSIGNARFIYLGEGEPEIGAWIPFRRNLAEDFRQQWGRVPYEFEKLRCLFEVRYDGLPPDAPEVVGDVYYDALYLGD
jgi:hypothetical protein